MANIHANPNFKRYNTVVLPSETQFRYIKSIDSLTDEELNDHGFYHGYTCAYGHTIRDQINHWCYHCVVKIISNNCGFDINFLHQLYKLKYFKLWGQVNIKNWDECWEAPNKMVTFPSYRSMYSKKKTENVSFHKAIYQCAWGDIGKGYVTRSCGNKNCVNPLHLVSTWNRAVPPQTVYPFELEFKADKLMKMATKAKNHFVRPTISYPQDVLNE